MKLSAPLLSLVISSSFIAAPTFADAPAPKDVLNTYVNIAQAGYEDSLTTAQSLQVAVNALLEMPSEKTLMAARAAWKDARAPYQQTEVYRFGNAIVDDWEGRVNAWPLDEGLIDYVDAGYGTDSDENAFYTANIVANAKPMIGGQTVDATKITPALLGETLHEIDDVEANVATGYHAIEFLLWGQDLHGNKPGTGERPATDFSLENCTGGNCDRRRDYLSAATELLITDLEEMVANWAPAGAATKDLFAKGEKGGLSTMLTGMGSLAYGELAGERTQLGLMLNDPEEEHDCFSDNTHWSHYYDAAGIKNVYLGEYTRVDGTKVSGPSLSDLLAHEAPKVDAELKAKLNATEAAMQAMVDAAESGSPFDVLIAQGNTAGNQIVQASVDALVAETEVIEKAIAALELDNIEIEGSDSLDNPSAVGH